MNNSATAHLDRMSKDFIDRNHLIKSLETILNIAELDGSSKEFKQGLLTAIDFIKLEKTEY
jgi:hypothetical protein